MINQMELMRQTYNIQLRHRVDKAKKELSNTVQEHLFALCAGMTIKQVESKLAKLEAKLL